MHDRKCRFLPRGSTNAVGFLPNKGECTSRSRLRKKSLRRNVFGLQNNFAIPVETAIDSPGFEDVPRIVSLLVVPFAAFSFEFTPIRRLESFSPVCARKLMAKLLEAEINKWYNGESIEWNMLSDALTLKLKLIQIRFLSNNLIFSLFRVKIFFRF